MIGPKKRRLLFTLLCLATIGAMPNAAAAQDSLPPLPGGAFTVVVIPDTQHYVGPGTKIARRGVKFHPGMKAHPYIRTHSELPDGQAPGEVANRYLETHIDWITGNAASQNIAFVSHVGDIVEIDRPEEWAVARSQLDRLRGVVPFGLTVGNHDMQRDGDASHFQAAFPAASFAGFDWYLESYRHDRDDQEVSANNVNSAQLFSAGGHDFVFLHLECNAPDDVLAWANDLLERYRDRHALISTHMDLGIIERPTNEAGYIHDPKGRMQWAKRHGDRGNTGQDLWEKLFRRHANVGFVFSGDQSRVTAMHLAETGDHGQVVHSLLSDYMSRGALRLVRFVPDAGRVDIVTYDTMLGRLVESMPYAPRREQHQFSIDFDFARDPQ